MAKQPASRQTPADVRMRGFPNRSTLEDSLAWLDSQLQRLSAEDAPLLEAAGRVLAAPIVSRVDVPGFARAMMDGFAVRADDTLGATPYNPLPLNVLGESLPGKPFEGDVAPGTAARIMTGAPLPAGADAVLPVERVQIETERIAAMGELSPGKHVGAVGEDVSRGQQVLPAGRRLRPQDLGVLSSIGCGQVAVVRRPRVRIVVTGDELLPPGSQPAGCQIVDANSPMLTTLIASDGGIPKNPGIIPDRPEEIRQALHDDADVILVSGGSSVGQEDHAPVVLAESGELAIHGVAMRPSSPAGMGRLGPRLVFLLPGNPVSCLCAYDTFAGRAIRALGGLSPDWPYPSRKLPLLRKLVSAIGRVDYARVRVSDGQVEPLAISGASVLSSTTRADGFVLVPGNSEGYPEGAEVEVFFYDCRGPRSG